MIIKLSLHQSPKNKVTQTTEYYKRSNSGLKGGAPVFPLTPPETHTMSSASERHFYSTNMPVLVKVENSRV